MVVRNRGPMLVRADTVIRGALCGGPQRTAALQELTLSRTLCPATGRTPERIGSDAPQRGIRFSRPLAPAQSNSCVHPWPARRLPTSPQPAPGGDFAPSADAMYARPRGARTRQSRGYCAQAPVRCRSGALLAPSDLVAVLATPGRIATHGGETPRLPDRRAALRATERRRPAGGPARRHGADRGRRRGGEAVSRDGQAVRRQVRSATTPVPVRGGRGRARRRGGAPRSRCRSRAARECLTPGVHCLYECTGDEDDAPPNGPSSPPSR